ncbi:MAG: hypothetical protein LAP85_08310 [Acidobacteriia bacterium]|nr:hypothetical protein [Terriglobia bacterium]
MPVNPFSAYAQEFPKYEFFGGGTFARLGGANWFGYDISGAKNLNRFLGIAVDVGRFDWSDTQKGSGLTWNQKRHIYTFWAGPRVTSRDAGKLAPFLHLMLGVARNHYSYRETLGTLVFADAMTDTRSAMMFGGGIDVRLKGPLAVRAIQADYTGLRMPGSTFAPALWEKGLRLSFGLNLRLGSAPQ